MSLGEVQAGERHWEQWLAHGEHAVQDVLASRLGDWEPLTASV